MYYFLLWSHGQPLEVVETLSPPKLPFGTYVRCGRGRESPWKMRVKRRGAGHKWKHIPHRDLPKKLRVNALLLGIQV